MVTKHAKIFLSGNLDRHISEVHKKEKNFLCQECPKSFTQKKSLDLHVRKVHTLEKPYPCEQCDLCFVSTHTLKMHIIAKHNGEKKFMCDSCPAKFGVRSCLLKHLETKSCGRKPGRIKKSDSEKSTKRAPRKEKQKELKNPSNYSTQHAAKLANMTVPEETAPSPEVKEERFEYTHPAYYIQEASADDSSPYRQTDEVPATEMDISQLEKSLRHRVYDTFKDHDRSEIISLIGRQVLNQNDLTYIVLSGEEVGLKASEFIETIIHSFQNQ